MTPSPADFTSPLEAIRQLKALLDQGAITAAEYDTLKQRLLSTGLPATPATDAPAAPAAQPFATNPAPEEVGILPPPPPPSSLPPLAPAAPMPAANANAELPSLLDMFQQTPPAPLPERRGAGPELAAPRLVPVAPIVTTPAAPPAPTTGFSPEPPAAPAPTVAAAPTVPPPPDFLPPAPAVPAAAPAPSPADSYPESTPLPAAEPLTSDPALSEKRPFDDLLATLGTPAAAPLRPDPVRPKPAYQPPVSMGNRTLPKLLLVLGALGLLMVLAYLFLSRDQTNEHLTSLSKTAADSVAVRPETGPQAEQPRQFPATEPEVVRPVPAAPPAATPAAADTAVASAGASKAVFPEGEKPTAPAVAAAASVPTATPTAKALATSAPPAPSAADTPAGAATAPEDGDDDATTRARQALASYYADLQAPPFDASQHFAPTVERLYTRQNLTPAAIEEELNRSMFPEFKQLSTHIVPGTLRVGPPAADGTRTATYTEQSRAFRVSKNQHQRTRTQVRVRFDPDFKMTYMRQEKLLENTFEQ